MKVNIFNKFDGIKIENTHLETNLCTINAKANIIFLLSVTDEHVCTLQYGTIKHRRKHFKTAREQFLFRLTC